MKIKVDTKYINHQIDILTAFKAGTSIQGRKTGTSDEWHEVRHTEVDWLNHEFRIKPAPKEIWENVYMNRGGNRYFHPTELEAAAARGLSCIATLHYKQVMNDNSSN